MTKNTEKNAWIRSLKTTIKDKVFPQMVCLLCEDVPVLESGLCEECENQMRKVPKLVQNPKDHPAVYTLALFPYESTARDYVLLLKNGIWDIPSTYLAQHMAQAYKKENWDCDWVVPVPIPYFRKCKRGYNQAEKLAQSVAECLSLPCKDILHAKSSLIQQKLLNRMQRLESRNNAYSCKADLSGKTILLIDDVITTGTTTKACANELRKAGAKKVYILCALYA